MANSSRKQINEIDKINIEKKASPQLLIRQLSCAKLEYNPDVFDFVLDGGIVVGQGTNCHKKSPCDYQEEALMNMPVCSPLHFTLQFSFNLSSLLHELDTSLQRLSLLSDFSHVSFEKSLETFFFLISFELCRRLHKAIKNRQLCVKQDPVASA